MLFKHFQFAAHPGFTDQGAQGRDQLGDELGSAQIHHRLVQAFAQTGQVMRQQTVHERVQIDGCCADGQAGSGHDQLGHADALKFFQRHGHHLAGSKALVEQAFDGAQFFHLRLRVAALVKRIPLGLREAVTPLPNPQGVFANTGVALDGGDGQMGLGIRHGGPHGVIVIEMGWFLRVS